MAQGNNQLGVEQVPDLRLFIWTAGGLLMYDHPEWSYAASQLGSIKP
jgi:hypothetical protein